MGATPWRFKSSRPHHLNCKAPGSRGLFACMEQEAWGAGRGRGAGHGCGGCCAWRAARAARCAPLGVRCAAESDLGRGHGRGHGFGRGFGFGRFAQVPVMHPWNYPAATRLRTKNRSRWQVLTFRGRRTGRCFRCCSARILFPLVTEPGRRIALPLALVLLNQTTSNRQNLPARAVFRARACLQATKVLHEHVLALHRMRHAEAICAGAGLRQERVCRCCPAIRAGEARGSSESRSRVRGCRWRFRPIKKQVNRFLWLTCYKFYGRGGRI